MSIEFEYPRDFKGIFIPKEIWLDDELSAIDKFILAEIDSLDVDGGEGCYASNEYLSKFCKCSVTKVSTSISKLIELGYVRVAKSNGRKRFLKVCLSKFESQPIKKCKSDYQKMKQSNIDNNIVDEYSDKYSVKNKTLPIGRDDKNFSLSDEREKPKPQTAKERYLDKKANELKMQGRMLTIAHDKFDKETADEVFNGLCYYLTKYTEKTNLIHPILTDNTLTEIITKLGTFQTDYGDKIVDCPNLIQDMIDEFFNTDFGSRTGQKTNWNLPHFMSDTVLNMLSERLK